MALALEAGERLPAAMRRMATEQLDDAVARLDVLPRRDDEAFHKAVHTSRKSLKKTRALLRLVRDPLGVRSYRRENAALRDAARLLSPARDAAVMRSTLASVAEDLPEALVERVDGALAEDYRLATHDAVVGVVVDDVLDELHHAKRRVCGWALDDDDFGLVAPGLLRTYRRGIRAMRHVQHVEVGSDPDRGADEWHEWRKRAKCLWYQLRVLRPTSPVIDSLVAEADELGELLGDDHDLAVLRAAVLGEPTRFGSAEQVAPLVSLLDARSDDLRSPALELGRRLYLDEPDAFVHRLEVHWRAWQVSGRRPTVPSIAEIAPIP